MAMKVKNSRKHRRRVTMSRMDSVSVIQLLQKKNSLWRWPECMVTYSG